MSGNDDESSSVHQMTSMKTISQEITMTSESSQRRPLVIGKNLSFEEAGLAGKAKELMSPEAESEHNQRMKDLYSKYDLLESDRMEEKGILESESGKAVVEVSRKTESYGVELDLSHQDDFTKEFDELLESTKLKSSSRRLMSDSGITSVGSSFSSESDFNIAESSIQEMKELLHGKSDSLFQRLESGSSALSEIQSFQSQSKVVSTASGQSSSSGKSTVTEMESSHTTIVSTGGKQSVSSEKSQVTEVESSQSVAEASKSKTSMSSGQTEITEIGSTKTKVEASKNEQSVSSGPTEFTATESSQTVVEASKSEQSVGSGKSVVTEIEESKSETEVSETVQSVDAGQSDVIEAKSPQTVIEASKSYESVTSGQSEAIETEILQTVVKDSKIEQSADSSQTEVTETTQTVIETSKSEQSESSSQTEVNETSQTAIETSKSEQSESSGQTEVIETSQTEVGTSKSEQSEKSGQTEVIETSQTVVEISKSEQSIDSLQSEVIGTESSKPKVETVEIEQAVSSSKSETELDSSQTVVEISETVQSTEYVDSGKPAVSEKESLPTKAEALEIEKSVSFDKSAATQIESSQTQYVATESEQSFSSDKSEVTVIESSQSQTKHFATESEQSFSSSSVQKVQTSKKQASRTNVNKGKLDHVQVNESDARKLAGMYLFDTGPQTKKEESKHRVPELEIIYRKEALGKIDSEQTIMDISESAVTQNVEIVDSNKSGTEFLTSEMSNDLQLCDTTDIKVLNELNIENSKREELIEASTHAQAHSIVEKNVTEGQSTLEQQSSLQSQKRLVKTKEQGKTVEQVEEMVETKVSSTESTAESGEDSSVQQSEISSKSAEVVSSTEDTSIGKTESAMESSGDQSKQTGINKDQQSSSNKDKPLSTDKDSLSGLMTSSDGDASNIKSKSDAESTTKATADSEAVELKSKGDAVSKTQTKADNEALDLKSKGDAGSTTQAKADSEASDLKSKGDAGSTTQAKADSEASDLKSKGEADSTTQAKADSEASDLKSKGDAGSTTQAKEGSEASDLKSKGDAGCTTQTKGESVTSDLKSKSDTESTANSMENAEISDLKSEGNQEAGEAGDRESKDLMKITKQGEQLEEVSEEVIETKTTTKQESKINQKLEDLDKNKTDVTAIDKDATDGSAKQDAANKSKTDSEKADDKKTVQQDGSLKTKKKVSFSSDEKMLQQDTKDDVMGEVQSALETNMVDDVNKTQTGEKLSAEKVDKKSVKDKKVSKKVTEEQSVVTYSDEMEDLEVISTVKQIKTSEKGVIHEACEETMANGEEHTVTSTDKYKKELKLCAANESSDQGPRFVDPLDERLVVIDDTQPEVPNIIIVIPNWKQNKVRVEDASLTDELRRRGLSTKFIDDDYNITQIGGVAEAGDIFVTAPAEVKMATSLLAPDGEPMVVAEAPDVVEKETGEKIPSSKAPEEPEIVEESVQPEAASKNNKEVEMDKLDSLKPKVTVLLESTDVNVIVGESFKLMWKMEGASWSAASIYKNGKKVRADTNIKFEIIETKCIVTIIKASLSDKGVYSIGVTETETNLGKVTVDVAEKQSKPKEKPIKVLTDKDNISVQEGETIEIQWKIEGTSWSSASIYRESTKITAEGRVKIEIVENICKLIITKATIEDQGKYSIKISGEEKSIGNVNVTVTTDSKKSQKPSEPTIEILTDTNDVTVKEGEIIVLKWKIVGASWSSTSITKNGKTITSDENLSIKVDGDVCTLRVNKATVSDSADYGVKISNTETILGKVTVSVTTEESVKKEPTKPSIQVVTDQENVSVTEGESFDLKWKITGESWSSTTITKNGKKITSDEKCVMKVTEDVCTLHVDKASVSDSAIYGVQISNTETVLGNVTVSVTKKESVPEEKPVIEVVADSDIVNTKEGETFQLKWKISGMSWSSLHLTKDGEELKSSDRIKIKVKEDVCTLTIYKATLTDAAIYGVNIPDTGCVLGQVSVSVTGKRSFPKKKKPTITAFVSNVDVKEGEIIELKWNISGISVTAENVYKGDASVITDDNVHITIKDDVCKLCIDKASVSDSSVYSIKHDNTQQGEISVAVSVDEQSGKSEELEAVAYALMDTRNIDVKQGESFDLKWKVTGAEWATASIYKDNDKLVITDDSKQLQVIDDICTLTIKSARQSDTAIYSVMFENSEQKQGEVFVDVITEERSKPTKEDQKPTAYVLMDKRNVQVVEGESFQIKWKITGTGWTSVDVLKDCEKVVPDAKRRISITDDVCTYYVDNATITDDGDYTIKLDNSDKAVGEVVVNVATSADSKLTASAEADVDATKTGKEDGLKISAEVDTSASQVDEKTEVQEAAISVETDVSKTEADKKPVDEPKLTVEDDTDSSTSKTEDKKPEQEPTVSAEVDTSKSAKDQQSGLDIKAEVDVESKAIKSEEKKPAQEPTISAEVDTSKSAKDQQGGLEIKAEVDVDSKTTEPEEKKPAQEPTISAEVDTSKSVKDQQGGLDVKAKVDVESKATKAEEKKSEEEPTISAEVDTSKSAKDQQDGLEVKAEVDADSKTTKSEEKKPKQEPTISAEVDTSKSAKDQQDGLEVKAEVDVESKAIKTEKKTVKQEVVISADIDTSSKQDTATGFTVGADNTSYNVNEGDSVSLTWKMSAADWTNACIYKDGTKYLKTAVSENVNIQNDTCILNISNATVEDGAVYSIRFDDSTVSFGQINVNVAASQQVSEDVVIEESMDKQEAKKNKAEVKLPKTPEEDKKPKATEVQEEMTQEVKEKVEAAAPVDKLAEKKDEKAKEVKEKEPVKEPEPVSEEMDKVQVKKEQTEVVFDEKKEPVTEEARPEVTEEVKKDEVKKVEQKIPELTVENEEGLVTDDSMALVKVDVDEVDSGKVQSEGFLTEVSGDDENIFVKVGEPFLLEWQIDGASTDSINVYKDGSKLLQDENTQMEITDDLLTVLVSRASVLDAGIYAVRFKENGPNQGEITVDVASEYQMEVIEEPKFVAEPTVDVKFGRRLSLKCAVTGFPEPEVTWYHEGEALQTDALWDVYTHDGYHWLRPCNSMTLINCNEIVCRVDNDGGFVQRVVKVQREGNEVYCEPIFPPVCEEQLVELNRPPTIDLEISEVNTDNLRKLTMLKQYTDHLNAVTFREGSVVDLIACIGKQNILARNHPVNDKVCYLPKHCVTSNSDVNNAVSLELDTINILSSVTQQEELQVTEDINMPERRKMKSPSPKMTSTPKTKRRGENTEETEKEIQQRLGFNESPNGRKEFSQPGESAELSTEYNDGTTRPMFKRRLKSTTAKTGERAQLECQVSGNPLPKILWLKNNRPLKASDGCKVVVDEGTNTLVFPQARDEDAGIYTARAMNVNGSIMCSAEFSLSDGESQATVPSTDSPLDLDFTTPAYFFQMSSCEVSEGRLARFDCRVVAYPRPEIVWMRDGKVIDVDVRFKLLNFNNEIYSLLIQDVRIEDTGRYTCWARNKFGEAMTEAYLNVKVLSDEEDEGDIAPKFLTRFYDQQTTEGTQSGFKCLIAGRPEPSVTWLLDDIEIHDTPGIRMRHVDGTVSLEIRSPKVDHSGSYTCQLSNKAGQAVCSAKLTVIEDKLHGRMLPKFIKKFDHIAGKEGEDVKFSAVIVGEPRPDVMWLYDHKPIPDANRRFIAKEDGDAFTLLVKNLRFDDAGKITCKAVNSEGEVYCSANLTVRDSKFMRDQDFGLKDETDAKFGYCPTFTKRLQDMSVSEGSKATFDCRVMGIPDPEIAWMKDGRVITAGGRIRMTYENGFGQLIIDNVSSADTGVYTCIISNSQGKSSSTAALKLEDASKKDKYKPEKLEDRLSRKDRYSPDKFLLDEPVTRPKRAYMDESMGARPKRPYVDLDKKFDVSPKRVYNKSLASLDDCFITKIRYESPESLKKSYVSLTSQLDAHKPYKSPLDTYKPYESPLETYKPYESPLDTYKPYESPLGTYKPYESPKSLLESSAQKYEPYKPIIDTKPYVSKYESPLESPKRTYQSPVRQFDSSMISPIRYESPIRQYEPVRPTYQSPKRYQSPISQYEPARPLYESPKTYEREEPIKAVPKMPTDRPSLLSKREESVTLSWLPAQIYDLPEGARHVSYIVESRELPNQSWKKLASSVAGTTFTARNLVPDRDYEFRVRAQNQHGMSEPTWNAVLDKRVVDDKSRQIDIPEVRAPPRLPTHRPIITDLGEETVRLAWKPVEPLHVPTKRIPPVSYRLEAKELPGKDWVPMTDRLRDTSHYLSQLGTDRDYMIRVRAENDYGISEPTEPLWLPRARTFPGVPITRPKIVDYEETRAKLNWSRVDIPTFSLDDSPLMYMLEVEEPPFKDWRTIARDLDDTEYLVEGLRPGQDYRFRIRAKTATGVISEPSPAVSLYNTLAQGRSPIDRLQMLDYEPDTRSLQLTWDRVHIPPYNMDDEPLMYMIEYNEPPMPDWKPLVSGIPTTRYRVMHLDPQRDYNFRVRALTSYGVSPPSPSLPVSLRQTAAPRGLPEAVVISEVDTDSLRLTWKRPMYDLDRPISYKIEMLEPPFTNWRPIATNVTATTYKVTGLRPTKDYQFRVIPQIGSSYLEPTPSAALTMLPVKPRLPMTEPKLKELTPESIQLSWRPAEVPAYQRKHQPIYYKVEMLELPSSTWVPVARKLTTPSYNMTGLRPDVEYKFRVFAETDGGFSEPSLPAVLHRRPVPKFSSNMPTIKDISQNVVYIAWKPADIYDGASPVSYTVEMQTPPGIGSWRTLYANHPMPSVRLADLRPDLDYMVRVRVQCGSYLSEPTLPLYIPRRAATGRHMTKEVEILDGTPPRMSTEQPYAVDIGTDYVKLQWRSAEIPHHIMDYAPITYRLEAQEFPDTTWITIQQGIPHTDFKVTGLNPQRDYSFRVRAENEFGVSDPTQPMHLHKRSVAPILPQDEPMLYDVTSGSCRLSWRPASLPSYSPHTSPITYTLFVQEYPFKVWRPLVKRIPHTSYFLTGLQPDKEYMFRIQAENDCGTSKPTSAVRLPKYSDIRRPVSMPEVSEFDDDLTSVKLRWQPRTSPMPDRKPGKYTLETWEPVRRVWKPVARGVPDTSYHIRDLPKIPDHLFRVRVETEPDVLSEPSMPVSISKYSLPKMPIYKPQLYEVDQDTVRLSWQPVHVPEGTSRRQVRYIIEQRELPETHWFPVANDVTETSYKIRGLRMKSDYEFRVKAVIDGTTTSPSYPVTLFRRPVVPKVKFDAPQVYDVDDTSLSLKWNTVDVPAFERDEEPLLFVIERQTLPGYEWTPVATNVTDRSYKVTDLKPYEDYNFRIRGVYPSGYTDPSPYVPVYRRPSESKLGLESSYIDYTSSQKYSSFDRFSPLPSSSLHATTPSELQQAINKGRAVSSPPLMRRYSLANIYEARELYPTEAKFEKVPIPEPKFKKEDAYVYKKNRAPSVPDFRPPVHEPIKTTDVDTPKDKKRDLYAWYKTFHRLSDAGLEEKHRSRRSEYLEEQAWLARRRDIMFETHQPRIRAESVPVAPRPVPRQSEPVPKYPSVADRYEDIKCPFIVKPGHWMFPKRHSISLDWEDLQKLQAKLRAQSEKLSTKPRTKADIKNTPRQSLISQSQDDYFGGTYFKVQDEVNFNYLKPVYTGTSSMYRRSLSQERDPGYFVVSKFSVAFSGVRKSRQSRATESISRERYVRPASVDPSFYTRPASVDSRPFVRPVSVEPSVYTRPVSVDPRPYYGSSYTPETKPFTKARSMTPDLNDLRARSYSPNFYEIKERVMQRSDSLARELAQSRVMGSGYKRGSRASVDLPSMPRSPVRQPSPPRAKEPFVKPRAYSISVPRDAKFNRNIAESRSLINNYERLEQRSRRNSIAPVPDNILVGGSSVSEMRLDANYTSTPRGSTSSDRRYSVSHSQSQRSSISTTNTDHARLAAAATSLRNDPKFSTQRRATIASTVNADLHSKLTSISNSLQMSSSSKSKKKSRPTMKFKSSRGEGVVE